MSAVIQEIVNPSFYEKKFLVTGARGFIGKNLVSYLKGLGSEVVEIDAEQGRLAKGDVEKLTSAVSCVFHVGANSNTMEKNLNSLFEQNFSSTLEWADSCNKYEKPLIYSSSAASYGTDGSAPSNPYGWSKYAAEELVKSKSGISLRYFNVYGPGETHKGVMASFAHQAHVANAMGEAVKIFPGTPKRDFVHVFDVVQANLIAYLNSNELFGRVFDVGTGTAISFERVLELMEIAFEYLPETSIPAGYQFYTKARRDKFIPNWKPEISPEVGFTEYNQHLKTMWLGKTSKDTEFD